MDTKDDEREGEQEWPEDLPTDPSGQPLSAPDADDHDGYLPTRPPSRRRPQRCKRPGYQPPSELDRD